MKGRLWVKVLGMMAILSIGAFAQINSFTEKWKAGKLHPCTGDSVEVTAVTNYATGGGGEKITLTVLGVSKEWNNFNTYMNERSSFIHSTIGLAGLNCASGGVTSLPATAAVATFQQTVFTNTAKPRMAAVPLTPKSEPTASPTRPAQVTPTPTTTDNQATIPTTTPTTPEEEMVTLPNRTNTQPEETKPVTIATETSNESGKAVQLEVAKKESGTRATLPPNNVTTDLEWNNFSQKDITGNNFALRAGYSRTLSNDKITLGGTVIVNTMIMMDKLFFNNAINLSGTYLLTESSTLERKIGGSVNTFIVDKKFYGTPFGMSIVASFSDNWFINQDNIVTYGGMIQESFVGDFSTTLLTAGVLFGLPIGERFAINPSAVFAYNIYTAGKKGSVTLDSPFMLQPSLNGSIYFSRLFTLDIGGKITLFIEDYSDIILTIGSTVLF